MWPASPSACAFCLRFWAAAGDEAKAADASATAVTERRSLFAMVKFLPLKKLVAACVICGDDDHSEWIVQAIGVGHIHRGEVDLICAEPRLRRAEIGRASGRERVCQ